MLTVRNALLLATLTLSLQACMTPIGKEEFTCPNKKKGGVCAGPRDIYKLTNSRTSLEDIDQDGSFDGVVITQDEDGNSVAVKREKTPSGTRPSEAKAVNNMDNNPVVYEPRDAAQQSSTNYQAVKPLPQVRSESTTEDNYAAWPHGNEPLAPEPLAVIEPPKVMRMLIASYKDARGNLNMPGYVFVQVEAETWSIGEAANMRPQRVIPQKVREQATKEVNASKQRQQGVSPIETTMGQGPKVNPALPAGMIPTGVK